MQRLVALFPVLVLALFAVCMVASTADSTGKEDASNCLIYRSSHSDEGHINMLYSADGSSCRMYLPWENVHRALPSMKADDFDSYVFLTVTFRLRTPPFLKNCQERFRISMKYLSVDAEHEHLIYVNCSEHMMWREHNVMTRIRRDTNDLVVVLSASAKHKEAPLQCWGFEINNLTLSPIMQPPKLDLHSVKKTQSNSHCALLGTAHAVALNEVRVSRNHRERRTGQESSNSVNGMHPIGTAKRPRIFCGIYTHAKNHPTSLNAVRSTWARRCTAFLAFSTEGDEDIPAINLPYRGDNRYSSIWQRVRSIWKYIYTHYIDEFDWFLLGGDDMYYIIENLEDYLASDEIMSLKRKGAGVYLGRPFHMNFTVLHNGKEEERSIRYNAGGAGYVLDQIAVRKLATHLDEVYCMPDTQSSEEDVLVGACLQNADESVLPSPTSDSSGRHRFHNHSPGFEYDHEGLAWIPSMMATDESVSGPACCASDSVSFHYVNPHLMHSIDDYIYRCTQEAKDAYFESRGPIYYDEDAWIEEKNREYRSGTQRDDDWLMLQMRDR